MSIKITDRWLNDRQRATPAEVFVFFDSNPPARRPDSERIVERVFTLCANAGVDFALAMSRIADETGALNGPSFFVSDIYRLRLNIGGLGVTDGGDEGLSFDTPERAADAYMAHLFTYILKPTYNILGVTKDDDPRFDATPVAWRGSVKTLDDLRGRWFTNPQGAINSAARGNRIFPGIPNQEEDNEVPDTITFGNVPLPDIEDRTIPSDVNTAWDNLGKRTVRGIVWHRSQGTHRGNDNYFRGEGRTRALTDYGIGVAAVDGAALAGSIYQWNDPEGTRSPWANGRVSNPYGDGLAFLNQYGLNAVGRDLTSVEISGFFPVPGQETRNTPLDEQSRQAIAELTAYWADQYKVSHETFPLIPGEGNRSFVIWHQELTIGTGKVCPGKVVMDETASLIERTRGILKKYQTSEVKPPPKPPTYAEPDIPDWMDSDLEKGAPTDHVHNGVQVFASLRPYEAVKPTKRRQTASLDSPVVGPPLKVREKFAGWYWSKSPDGKRTWVWTPYGTRVDASALTPRVSIRKA